MTLLQGLFRLVLSLSLTGSLAALLVLMAKAVTRDRLGPGWNYYIWMLPMALYLCPVPFSPGWGRSAPPASAAAAAGSAAGGLPAGNAAGGIPGGDPGLWRQLLPVLAWVWLLGVIFAAAVRMAEGHRLRTGLRSCCREPSPEGPAKAAFREAMAELGIREGRVALVICPGVESPMAAGLLRPAVMLPREDLPREQLGMMLRHELHHCRSRDLWYKAAAAGIACLHWFNPLVWLMIRDLNRCCELRCDQRTAGGMGAKERRLYGRMLLDIAQGQPVQIGLPLTGDKEELRRRLSLLREGWKRSRWEQAASAGIAAAVAAVGVICAASVYPGPVLIQSRAEEPAPAEAAGEEEIPPLWSGGTEGKNSGQSEAPAQPPLRMQAVLADEVTGSQAPPADDKTEAPTETSGTSGDEGDPAEETPELTDEEAEAERQLEELKARAEYRPTEEEEAALCWDGGLLWPVDGGEISYHFSGYAGHTGVDIRADPGTEIYAAADGVVVYATDHSVWPYGKRVDIDHGDGVMTRYAHCSKVLVAPGEEVQAGQLIALVGRTGNATGNHCHFEVRIEGEALDPLAYIAG